MFIYLFPIFCFGLVITGVVYLGILEASEQFKTYLAERVRIQTLKHELDSTPSPDTKLTSSTVLNSRE
jgi:hypothetical protein